MGGKVKEMLNALAGKDSGEEREEKKLDVKKRTDEMENGSLQRE